MKKGTEQWLFHASEDIISAETLLASVRGLGNAAFHCHQAAEKCLKALLNEKGLSILKTHNLIHLHEKVVESYGIEFDIEKITKINELYIETRYPADYGLLSDGLPREQDVQSFLEIAREIFKKVDSILRKV